MKRQISLVILLASISLTVACGGAEPVSSACGPVPEEELEDCVIDVDPQFSTAEDLQALCDTRCSRIDGGISIVAIDGVTDLRAFENVREAFDIDIEFTKDLKSLDGIENIRMTEESRGISIRSNADLRSIEALNAQPTPSEVRITNNPKLESLRGLENVVEAGEVVVDNNDSLKNFEGLGNLQEARLVSAMDNDGLTSGDGLDSLTTITERGSFNLINTPNLVDLSNTLPAAESIQQVVLRDNPNLKQCDIDAFVERVGPVETRIESNGPDCE